MTSVIFKKKIPLPNRIFRWIISWHLSGTRFRRNSFLDFMKPFNAAFKRYLLRMNLRLLIFSGKFFRHCQFVTFVFNYGVSSYISKCPENRVQKLNHGSINGPIKYSIIHRSFLNSLPKILFRHHDVIRLSPKKKYPPEKQNITIRLVHVHFFFFINFLTSFFC